MIPTFTRLAILAGMLVSISALSAPLNTQVIIGTEKKQTRAKITINTHFQMGDNNAPYTEAGNASINTRISSDGLTIHQEPRLLTALESEDKQRVDDVNAPTPKTWGLNSLDNKKVRMLLTPAKTLAVEITQSTYDSLETVTLNNQPATKLRYLISDDVIPEHQKKYIKKFTGTLDIWIDEKNQIARVKRTIEAKGRAYLVVKFSYNEVSDRLYQTVDGQLMLTYLEHSNEQKSPGENQRYQETIDIMHEP